MKQLLYILGAIVLLSGCYDEDVKPSTEPELIYGKYTLPQGDHDYDDDIVAFYEKYGTLLLYQFTAKDFGWSPTGNVAWDVAVDTIVGDDTGSYKHDAVPADENYVGEQLELLQDKWFSYLSDTLMRMLPQRILLCSRLDTVTMGLGRDPVDESERMRGNVYSGYYHMAVNWGNPDVLAMTAEERNSFKEDVCLTFLTKIVDELGRSDDFDMITSYNSNMLESAIYEEGILDYSHRTSPTEDWLDYLALVIKNTQQELEAEGGLLSYEKIRQKYDIMVNFFKENYDFDIQAIGNDVE